MTATPFTAVKDPAAIRSPLKTASARVNGSTEVILESGSYLVGGTSITLTAHYDQLDIYAYARSICRCFGGYTAPDAHVRNDTKAHVNGKPNSTVKTASLVVSAFQTIIRYDAHASRSGAFRAISAVF